MLAGVLTGGITSKDNKVVTLWEETYIKNMKYAARRLQEVIIVNTKSGPLCTSSACSGCLQLLTIVLLGKLTFGRFI